MLQTVLNRSQPVPGTLGLADTAGPTCALQLAGLVEMINLHILTCSSLRHENSEAHVTLHE